MFKMEQVALEPFDKVLTGMLTSAPPRLYSVDLTGCTAKSAFAPQVATAAFVGALERAGATVVQTCASVFPGAGLTCVLILRESHAVLHTWPETGTVHLDIFSCSTRLKSRTAIAELGRSFGAAGVAVREIARADGHVPPSNVGG
jgi:S-adenosylmethionine decarboxylase proenzyme